MTVRKSTWRTILPSFMTKYNRWYSEFVTKVFETPSEEYSEWFGYYNYDTLNNDQTKMLCCRSKVDGVNPSQGMTIELGYYDILTGEWHHIDESDSWNWQQGAMLQWLETSDGRSNVIYNCSKDNHLISRIFNINTGAIKEIDWPIYGITPDKKQSIALDLERSYWCRAYHYQSVANPIKEGRVFEDDGIFEIDLEHNKRKKIISIQEIIATDTRPYFSERKHWIEHIMINPSGTRFCFLHRFSPLNEVFKYETRLFIANIDGSNLQCVSGWEDVRWSHFGWCGDDAFAIYTYFPSRFDEVRSTTGFRIKGYSPRAFINVLIRKGISCLPNRMAVRLGSPHSSYQFYQIDDNGSFKFKQLIDPKQSRIDGHPSFTTNEAFMITDTYGDKKSWQSLYVFDLKRRKTTILARFLAFYDRKPGSCDLHPKLCENNNYVAVDTAYNDKHHMVLFRIDWLKLMSR